MICKSNTVTVFLPKVSDRTNTVLAAALHPLGIAGKTSYNHLRETSALESWRLLQFRFKEMQMQRPVAYKTSDSLRSDSTKTYPSSMV